MDGGGGEGPAQNLGQNFGVGFVRRRKVALKAEDVLVVCFVHVGEPVCLGCRAWRSTSQGAAAAAPGDHKAKALSPGFVQAVGGRKAPGRPAGGAAAKGAVAAAAPSVDKRVPALSMGCVCKLLNAITDDGLTGGGGPVRGDTLLTACPLLILWMCGTAVMPNMPSRSCALAPPEPAHNRHHNTHCMPCVLRTYVAQISHCGRAHLPSHHVLRLQGAATMSLQGAATMSAHLKLARDIPFQTFVLVSALRMLQACAANDIGAAIATGAHRWLAVTVPPNQHGTAWWPKSGAACCTVNTSQ